MSQIVSSVTETDALLEQGEENSRKRLRAGVREQGAVMTKNQDDTLSMSAVPVHTYLQRRC